MHLKISSGKWRPFCVGFNVLRLDSTDIILYITSLQNDVHCQIVQAIISRCCHSALSSDRFVYAPSQWETTLQCNVVSLWLCAYTAYIKHDIDICNAPFSLQRKGQYYIALSRLLYRYNLITSKTRTSLAHCGLSKMTGILPTTFYVQFR